MSALLLYLATTIGLLYVWRRFLQPISVAMTLVLILLPLCFAGRALLTGSVYAPIDLPFMSEPMKDYIRDYGADTYNGTLSDLYMQMIPWRKAVRYAVAHGEFPLWDPFQLCGSVLAGAAQPAPYDPINILSLIIPLPAALTYSTVMTFFLGALFTFALARSIGCSEAASLLGAAGFIFSGDVAFFVGWPLARAWVFLPFVLYGVRLVTREVSLRGGVVLTVALLGLLLAGHPETALHVVAIGVAYGIFELFAVRKTALRAIGVAVASGVAALLLSAIAIFPFVAAATETVEGKNRGLSRNQPYPVKSATVAQTAKRAFLPFYGGQPWRDNYTPLWGHPIARVGSVILALALLSVLAVRPRRETWFFSGCALFCLWAAFDAPPISQLLRKLPLFDIALNTRFAFAASLALAVLAALACDGWWTRGARRRSAATVLIVILFVIAIATAGAWQGQQAAGVETWFLRMMVVAEIAPLVVLLGMILGRVRATLAVPIILGLVLLQRTAEDGTMYPAAPQRMFYPKLPLIARVQAAEPKPFRIIGAHFAFLPDTAALYELEDARGYEAMTFERLVQTYPLWAVPQPVSFNAVGDLRSPFLSFLNIRFAFASRETPVPEGWRLMAADRDSVVMENMRVMPRAFIPPVVRYGNSGSSILEDMLAATDFREKAWIEVPEYPPHDIRNGRGTVSVRRAGTGYELRANMTEAGWIVISESAWNGWRAYIDGHRVQTHYANHAFLGVHVPVGAHTVKLIYLPRAFTIGRNVTFGTLVILTLSALARWRKRSRKLSEGST